MEMEIEDYERNSIKKMEIVENSSQNHITYQQFNHSPKIECNKTEKVKRLDNGIEIIQLKNYNKNFHWFRFRIDKFLSIEDSIFINFWNEKEIGFDWNILITPYSLKERRKEENYVGLTLQFVPSMLSSIRPPKGWYRSVIFSIAIVNSEDETRSIFTESSFQFFDGKTEWKSPLFISRKTMKRMGYLVEGSLILELKLRNQIVCSIDLETSLNYSSSSLTLHNFSRTETGFVGLKNQGATCYLNSLLQCLFHIGYFRKAVYQLPTEKDVDPTKSIPLALQRIFYLLQFGNDSVSTKELTKSFGWGAYESFIQHDIQELNRVLCDNLEEKMKGTIAEGVIEKLFTGKIMNFVTCLNVNCESSRIEKFYDISLNVKGCKTIYESFDKYIEVELLVGDNKYDAEGYGLQDAKKGCRFISLPQVLQVHLKRFEYDPMKDEYVKVNDKFVFPSILDLNKYVPNSLVNYTYNLFGVLVHSGDVNAGHYYAFIRPYSSSHWYKFDDERVSIAEEVDVVDNNFGGQEGDSSYSIAFKRNRNPKISNAYMLVYIRQSALSELLQEIKEEDIPAHLKIRFEKELEIEENHQKELLESSLFIVIKLATFTDLCNHQSTLFDLMDFQKAKTFKVQKSSTLKAFKKTISHVFGIPIERQKFWFWSPRKNKTLRPDTLVSPHEEERTFVEIQKGSDIKLYLEEIPEHLSDDEEMMDIHPSKMVFLFFKYYDPFGPSVKFVGHTNINITFKLSSLIPKLNQLMKFPVSQSLILFEEVKASMVNLLNLDYTIEQSELVNGDIIVFQKNESFISCEFQTAPSYYKYIQTKIRVQFKPLKQPSEIFVELDLLTTMNFDQVTSSLAEKLENVDPGRIRLTAYHPYLAQPRSIPLKRADWISLGEVLNNQQMNTILYFEILDLPLSEIENSREVKVIWRNKKGEPRNEALSLLFPKDALLKEVVSLLSQKEKVDPSLIRVLEIFNNRIYKVFSHTDQLQTILSGYDPLLYAEEMELNEVVIGQDCLLVQVAHLTQESISRNFGNPILILIKKEEKLIEIKQKIALKLSISMEELNKWKIAFVYGFKVEQLKEDESVFEKFVNIPNTNTSSKINLEGYIGLEHETSSSKSFRKPERGISING